jgi:hypothetical protein
MRQAADDLLDLLPHPLCVLLVSLLYLLFLLALSTMNESPMERKKSGKARTQGGASADLLGRGWGRGGHRRPPIGQHRCSSASTLPTSLPFLLLAAAREWEVVGPPLACPRR